MGTVGSGEFFRSWAMPVSVKNTRQYAAIDAENRRREDIQLKDTNSGGRWELFLRCLLGGALILMESGFTTETRRH
jgi:hypothetical protein